MKRYTAPRTEVTRIETMQMMATSIGYDTTGTTSDNFVREEEAFGWNNQEDELW